MVAQGSEKPPPKLLFVAKDSDLECLVALSIVRQLQ